MMTSTSKRLFFFSSQSAVAQCGGGRAAEEEKNVKEICFHDYSNERFDQSSSSVQSFLVCLNRNILLSHSQWHPIILCNMLLLSSLHTDDDESKRDRKKIYRKQITTITSSSGVKRRQEICWKFSPLLLRTSSRKWWFGSWNVKCESGTRKDDENERQIGRASQNSFRILVGHSHSYFSCVYAIPFHFLWCQTLTIYQNTLSTSCRPEWGWVWVGQAPCGGVWALLYVLENVSSGTREKFNTICEFWMWWKLPLDNDRMLCWLH